MIFPFYGSKIFLNSEKTNEGFDDICYKKLRPSNILGFLEFMKIVVPEHIFLSKLKKKITLFIEQTAQNKKLNVKCFLKNIRYICIAVDIWTPLVNHSYLGVTYHY